MKFKDTKSIMLYLKQIKVGKEIPNKEIADKLGISNSAVSGLFNQKNISLNKLSDICDSMNCELHIEIIDKE